MNARRALLKSLASPAVMIAVIIFASGTWQLRRQSVAWPLRDLPLPFRDIVFYVAEVFLIGSVVGIFLGFIFVASSRAFGRFRWPLLRTGYFIGLDVSAVVMLWLMAATS